jgi:hypothetical protein
MTDDEILERAEQIKLDRAIQATIEYNERRRANIGKPGYTWDGRVKCSDAWCDYAEGHGGHHSND